MLLVTEGEQQHRKKMFWRCESEMPFSMVGSTVVVRGIYVIRVLFLMVLQNI